MLYMHNPTIIICANRKQIFAPLSEIFLVMNLPMKAPITLAITTNIKASTLNMPKPSSIVMVIILVAWENMMMASEHKDAVFMP